MLGIWNLTVEGLTKELTYSIATEVFAAFPDYRRGVVIARGVRNSASPAELVGMLREEEAAARGKLSVDMLTAEPRLAPWREAFRRLGCWAGGLPAVDRGASAPGGTRPGTPLINALVDIGNIVSLRHRLPVGGHAVDVLTRDIALRPASAPRNSSLSARRRSSTRRPGSSFSPRATRC